MHKKRIVIVGGGFGGIKAALDLQQHKQFSVKLISDKQHYEYHAALYRSATGWSPKEVVVPLCDIFDERSTVEVIFSRVIKIDASNKHILDADEIRHAYDELIISVGLEVNYYGIEGMAKHSYGLNTIEAALKLRQHLEQSVVAPKDEGSLEFVVIGGGATGVELASEISFFVAELCRRQGVPPKKAHVTLVEGSNRLLPILAPKASKFAQWRLEKLGVKVLLRTRAIAYQNDVLTLSDAKIHTKNVIWTAGATNSSLFKNNKETFLFAKNGKIEVDESLAANKHIYVIGDNANTQYSGMAQTAIYDGAFVAKNLIRNSTGKSNKLYVPHRPIYAIPVGRDYSVLQWGSVVLRGKIAWMLRRLADFRLFASFEPYRKAVKTWRAGNRRARGYELK